VRILFAGKQHFGVGGVQASTDQLARWLILAGHDVAALAQMPVERRADMGRLGIRRWPGLGYQAWAVSTVPPDVALHVVRRRFQPDVVVVNGGGRWYHDWTRRLLDASVGIPTVLYVRDHEALEMLHRRVRRPDLVLGNADAHAAAARRVGIPAATVPSVINRETYRTATTRECVLFMNPVPVKGLYEALDLARSRPDIPFLFQEAWPLSRSSWRSLVEQVGDLGNVQLAASSTDPSSYYGRARVVLAPYHDLNRPRVIAEAQVSGIPAVAIDDPAMREAVGPGGVLVPPGASEKAWLEGLAELWDDDHAYERYSESALEYSRRPEMDAEVVTDMFLAAIESLRPNPIRSVAGDRVCESPVEASSPIVSVIVPARNAADVIDRQLAALANQTYAGSWEVIVADNGSTDGTTNRVNRWSDRIPDLRVVDASGRACVSRARNVGMRSARGDFVLICDADDEVEPTWVEQMVMALEKHALVTGAMERSSLNSIDQYQWIGPALSTEVEVAYSFLPFAAGGNLGLRRSLLSVLGGFDERLKRAEDIDFSWRAWYAGYRIHFQPRAVIRIAMRPGLSSLARTRFRGGMNEVLLYKRHRSKGMHREPRGWVVGTWKWLLRTAPRLRNEPSIRHEWIATGAKRTGRLIGSLRHRALFL
jgi:GT2 family glycosyltransferase/glycosyltransferase involved in cell wall biosynthesis